MEKKMVCPNTEWNRKSTKGESKNRQPVMNVEDTVVMMCRDDVSKYKILMDFQLVRNVKLCRNGFCTYTATEVRLKENKSPLLSVELWKKVSYLIMGFFNLWRRMRKECLIRSLHVSSMYPLYLSIPTYSLLLILKIVRRKISIISGWVLLLIFIEFHTLFTDTLLPFVFMVKWETPYFKFLTVFLS